MQKFKQVFAIFLIVVLLSLYVMTFISAILANPMSHTFFKLSIALTFCVPVFIYVFLMFAKLGKKANEEKLEMLAKYNKEIEEEDSEN